jgi:hypothetical protein
MGPHNLYRCPEGHLTPIYASFGVGPEGKPQIERLPCRERLSGGKACKKEAVFVEFVRGDEPGPDGPSP